MRKSLTLVLFMAACGGSTKINDAGTNPDASTSSDASALVDASSSSTLMFDAGSCTALGSFAADGGVGAGYECHAAPYMVTCTDGNVSQFCLSAEPDACPPNPNNVSGTCTSDCNDGEYAVYCGDLSPTGDSALPDGCRSLGATPGGTQFGCCPCS